MACFASDGQGIALFSPAATIPWNFGPHASGATDETTAGPCVHLAPLDRVKLAPRSTYRYRYWLVLGDTATIATRLDALWKKYSAETSQLITTRDSLDTRPSTK
jgi:hypothetical protein